MDIPGTALSMSRHFDVFKPKGFDTLTTILYNQSQSGYEKSQCSVLSDLLATVDWGWNVSLGICVILEFLRLKVTELKDKNTYK